MIDSTYTDITAIYFRDLAHVRRSYRHYYNMLFNLIRNLYRYYIVIKTIFWLRLTN